MTQGPKGCFSWITLKENCVKKGVLFFLLLVPVLLLAQEKTHTLKPKLMFRVPLVNGSLLVSMGDMSNIPQYHKVATQAFGTGFWYFGKGRSSYQIDGNMDLQQGTHLTYVTINHDGPNESHQYFKDVNLLSTSLGFTFNYKIAPIWGTETYTFIRYQVYTHRLASQDNLIPGERTEMDHGTEVMGLYHNVYEHKITSRGFAQQIRIGWAVTTNMNAVETRFFLAFEPPRTYVHTASPLLSIPSPSFTWVEQSKPTAYIGASLAFNVALLKK